MIQSIKLRDVRCYDKDTEFTFDLKKRVSIVYGLNGTGKSTIADFINRGSVGEFSKCIKNVSTGNDLEYLVYNQDFVQKIFREKDDLPGIFTIGEADTKIEDAIEVNEKRLKNLNAIKDSKKQKLELVKVQRSGVKKTLKESVWSIVRDYKGTELDYCLEGYKNDKEKFVNDLISIPLPQEKPDIKSLYKKVEELNQYQDEKLSELPKLNYQLDEIEKNEVFNEHIIASGDSYLKSVITQLENSDWVSKGKDILDSEKYSDLDDEVCPFCQRELIDGFKDDLEKVFDDQYEKKKQAIIMAKNKYNNLLEEIKKKLGSEIFKNRYVIESGKFDELKNRFINQLEKNQELIDYKEGNLSEEVLLNSTNQILVELNAEIESINTKIGDFNSKVSERSQYLSDMKDQFWQYARNHYDESITAYEDELSKLNTQLKELRDYIERIDDLLETIQKRVKSFSVINSGVHSSVVAINNQIKSVGITGFELVKREGDNNHYRIERGNKKEGVFKSLSEGEKTLITFLYFLEKCRGSEIETDSIDSSKRIIVIDDPISSLSHNYIYEVASLIHYKIIKAEFAQVIILSHNLYFIHEFKKLRGAPKIDLFRLTKNKTPSIEEISFDEIRNDYESYWQSLKDVLSQKTNKMLMPILMRNILEHYFAFVHKENRLYQSLEKLEKEDNEYMPFFRYINRESHSDAVNISDFRDIEPDQFIIKFKQIFQETDSIEHYNKMMGQNG